MNLIKIKMLSPSKKYSLPNSSACYSFSNYPFEDFLEEYHGFSDIPIKVLILSCGDLPFAVHSTTLCSNQRITNITVTDESPITIARNVLFVKIISDTKFDPNSDKDLRYLWNVWYNMKWSSKTKNRFLKDVTELYTGKLPHNLKVPVKSDMGLLQIIWGVWISSVSDMNPDSMQQICDQRYESIINHIHGIVSNNVTKSKSNVYKPTLAEVWEWLVAVTKDHTDHKSTKNAKEIRIYFETGNCCESQDIKACINPTFLNPKTGRWALDSSVSPFETYFNLKQLPHHDFENDFLNSCKRGLYNQVKNFQKWLSNATLSLNIGDPLELCYCKTWTELFNIVDCSKLPDHVGLANILNAARLALVDDPHAVLLTHSSPWRDNTTGVRYDSAKEFIEESLCSSVQMIPTLYGLMLINHVHLGNPLPLRTSWRPSVRLQWTHSPSFKNMHIESGGAIGDFFETIQAKYLCNFESEKPKICESSFTLLAYCYLVSSFIARVELVETHREGLEHPPLPPSLQLAWNTLLAWMKGSRVLHMKINLLLTNKEDGPLRLVLATQNDATVQYIDNFGLSCDGCDIAVSFMLLENHNLDLETTALYLTSGIAQTTISSSCFLADASSTLFHFPPPFRPKDNSSAFLTCLEFEDFYHVDLPGIAQDDIILSTDREPPSEAGHCVTLLAGAICQELIFPWPFKVVDVHTSCDDDKRVRLILPKSMNEPHPFEWKDRRKWDISLLSPWNPESLLKDLNFHLSAQFDCCELKRQMLNEAESDAISPITCLKGVREIIRTLFQSTMLDGNLLYVIRSKNDPKLKNLWFIRVHLPILVSPSGAPILLLTANDHRLAQKLVDCGKLEQTTATEDFKRIFVEGVSSSEVCPIFVKSEEEESVLRYLLRVNATKIFTNVWPIKQIPVGETSPWLCTFVSPSYADQTGTDAEMEELVAATNKVSIQTQEGENILFRERSLASSVCSRCKQIKENLKRCSRCRSVKYCSVDCQRSDWPSHKASCL